jgi:hypothetical protein
VKVRLPKSWEQLPQSEKEIIAQVKEQEINQYLASVQKNMLMLQSIAMDMAGLTREQCLLVLANMREVYRKNSKILTDDGQRFWLEAEIDRIFGVGGYPYKYINKLEDM